MVYSHMVSITQYVAILAYVEEPSENIANGRGRLHRRDIKSVAKPADRDAEARLTERLHLNTRTSQTEDEPGIWKHKGNVCTQKTESP